MRDDFSWLRPENLRYNQLAQFTGHSALAQERDGSILCVSFAPGTKARSAS